MKKGEKNILITGASQGLGEAMAKKLARKDVRVIICARRKKKLEGLCRNIASRGGLCSYYRIDVTSPLQIRQVVRQIVSRFGRIDVLINNAGWISTKHLLEKTTPQEYNKYMETNTDSVFYFMKYILPTMRKQRFGLIINIASGAGKRGHGGLATYSASKFAVIGLTQAVGQETQKDNISCIAVCPGGIATPMRAKVTSAKEARTQQKPEIVADYISQIISNDLLVPSGGDITIQQGKITGINDPLA